MIFVIPFALAFSISVLLTPLAIIWAKKYGFVDDPRKHQHPAILHKKIIPRAGGVPIYLAFLISVLVIIGFSKQVVGILLGGLILLIVGIVDDRWDLRNSWKIITQFAAAAVAVASGVGIVFITNPLNSFAVGTIFGEVIRLDQLRITFNFMGAHSILILADIFALFWIVWVINMVNFSSGVDGQMPGIVLVTLIVISAASLRFFVSDPNQLVVTKLSLIGAGATLGFLIYNFYPAKIFPGDSGSYFLGFLVATVAILSGAKVGTAILVMAVPLIDGVFTIVRRVASGKSPFVGDRKHLQHRLMELGWNQRQVALFYWLLCAILGAAALALNPLEKLFAGIVISIIILGGLLWLNMNLPQRDLK